VLGASELGSLVLGTVPPSVLAEAGRASATSPEILVRADAFFGSTPGPFSCTHF
jgi:hypothetical protein